MDCEREGRFSVEKRFKRNGDDAPAMAQLNYDVQNGRERIE